MITAVNVVLQVNELETSYGGTILRSLNLGNDSDV